jgi:hypothetical protein
MSAPTRFPGLVIDLVVAAVAFAVLGVIGALVWHQVVDLPHYTRTAQGAEMDGLGLEELFGINGWYCLIGAVLGLLGGAALLLWRHREPVWILLVSAASSLLAALIMLDLGRALGPQDPKDALSTAKAGATAPVQLMVQAVPTDKLMKYWLHNPYTYAWLGGTVLGATLVLLFVSPRGKHPEPAPERVSTSAVDVA